MVTEYIITYRNDTIDLNPFLRDNHITAHPDPEGLYGEWVVRNGMRGRVYCLSYAEAREEILSMIEGWADGEYIVQEIWRVGEWDNE